MNANTASHGPVSKLQRTLLTLFVLLILFTSAFAAPAHAAGSSVGFISTSVTCEAKQYRVTPGFVPTYDGQWVYYRLWQYNNTTMTYTATAWQYLQVSGVGTYFSFNVPAPTGQIVSIKTEAYFYNNLTKTWDYAGIFVAQHWRLVSGSGTDSTYCKVY